MRQGMMADDVTNGNVNTDNGVVHTENGTAHVDNDTGKNLTQDNVSVRPTPTIQVQSIESMNSCKVQSMESLDYIRNNEIDGSVSDTVKPLKTDIA